MQYEGYEKALSKPRLEKYKNACKGDKNRALILYRYNIKLCQKFYGVLGVLEVVLRNAIDYHFSEKLSDNNWIENEATSGFLIDSCDTIFKERDKLIRKGIYSHDKLVASLSLGTWTFMFSRNCYKNSGKTLLQIFPFKTFGMSQSDIYKELDKIRNFRNRIAHYEPICINYLGNIYIEHAQEINNLIIKYIQFLGYAPHEIFYGVETPASTIFKIKELENAIIHN